MEALLIGTLTTGEWIGLIASALVLLLSVAPVVWACWLFVQMSDEAVAAAIDDAQRLADRVHRARAEAWRPLAGPR